MSGTARGSRRIRNFRRFGAKAAVLALITSTFVAGGPVDPASAAEAPVAQPGFYPHVTAPTLITLTATDPDGGPLTFTTNPPFFGTLSAPSASSCIATTCTATVIYTPSPGPDTLDEFTFDATDGDSLSSSATVRVTLGNSDPTVAGLGAVAAPAPGPTEIEFSAQDQDGDPTTFAVSTPPTHGTLGAFTSPSCTGVAVGTSLCTTTVSFTPDVGYNGPDGFSVTANDGTSTSIPGEVFLAVGDTPPIATGGFEHIIVPTALTLTGSDSDSPSLVFSIITPPAHGTLGPISAPTCTPGPPTQCTASVTVTPTDGYVGPDTFTFAVDDGTTATEGTFNLSIGNYPPDGKTDYLGVEPGESGTVLVLFNDRDADFNNLEVIGSTNGAHGTVTCETDGSCTYVAAAGYTGLDEFTYTVSDGFPGGTDVARVQVWIQPGANGAGGTVCPTVASAFDGGSVITGESWIECSSPDANAVVQSVTPLLTPAGGSAILLTSGHRGLASGPSTDTAASQSNNTATRGAIDVSILKLDILAPPGSECLAFNAVFASEEYPEYVGTQFNDGFLAELDTSDWSVSGSTITAPHNFAFGPDANIISVNSTFFDAGNVVEAPANGMEYDGSTRLLRVQTPITPGPHALYLSVFDAGDGILDSGVMVDGLVIGNAPAGGCVAGANQPPTAVSDTLTTPEDTAGQVTVTNNDSDPDPDPDTITVVAWTNGAHGTVNCTAAGVCTYTPAPNYSGPDSFTYTIADDFGATATTTVNVTVTPSQDPPVAVNDTLTTAQDTANGVNVLDNDDDFDGDTLTVTASTNGAHGTVSCTAAGVCTYTPAAGYSGPDSFTYTISDGQGGTDTATVNVTVTPADDRTLTVVKAGTGAGTVTSAPSGIACGVTCTETFSNATVVTLTASPAGGSTFTGWSGGGCSGSGSCVLPMTADTTVTATFTLIPDRTLTVVKAGTGAGTVSQCAFGDRLWCDLHRNVL